MQWSYAIIFLSLCVDLTHQHQQAYPPGVPPKDSPHMHGAQPPGYQGGQQQQFQGQNVQYQGQPNQQQFQQNQQQFQQNQQFQGQQQFQQNQQQQNLQFQQGNQQFQQGNAQFQGQGGQGQFAQGQGNTQQFQQQQRHPSGHQGGHPHGGFGHESAHDAHHIKEHLKEVVEKPKEEMTEEELEFHYFKLHDYDKNNKLDGIEIVKAITHFHDEGDTKPDHERKVFSDEELSNIVDLVLNEDDLNKDGYIEYPEFVMAQKKAREQAKVDEQKTATEQ